jgi:hypothetical protein
VSIYFCFSDESGSLSKKVYSNPYYIRSSLVIQAKEWKLLSNNFTQLKKDYELPVEREIKWSYLWNLKKYRFNNKDIEKGKPFKFLEKISEESLINFVKSAFNLINTLSLPKIILTVTDNKIGDWTVPKEVTKMHLQEIMQRLQMEYQNDEKNLVLLFIDPTTKIENICLKETYHDLFGKGDFIEKYSNIKDSLIIEHSHHSVGIQLADFIAGCFSSVLRGVYDTNNYKLGRELFYKYVFKHIRKYNEDIMGYGIIEIPKNKKLRKYLQDNISSNINNGV